MKTSTIHFIIAAICLIIAFVIGGKEQDHGTTFIGLMSYFVGLGVGYLNNEKRLKIMQSLIDKYEQLCTTLGVNTKN